MRRLLLVVLFVGTLPAMAEGDSAESLPPFADRVSAELETVPDRCLGSVRKKFRDGVELHCAFASLKVKQFLPAWQRAFPTDETGEDSTPLTPWVKVHGGWVRRYYEVDGVPVLLAYGGRHRGLVIAYFHRHPQCAEVGDIAVAGLDGIDRPVRVEQDWVQAIYPATARERRVEGMVLARAVIGTDGEIRDLCVVDVYPTDYGFEEAALEAWRRDRFQPVLRDGQPVEVQFPLAKWFRIE